MVEFQGKVMNSYIAYLFLYNPKYIDQKIVRGYFALDPDKTSDIEGDAQFHYYKYNHLKMVGPDKSTPIHYTMNFDDDDHISLTIKSQESTIDINTQVK